jgi:hypothetical protein
MRTTPLIVALGLIACTLSLATPAAAAPSCIGVPPSGGPLFTGVCRSDPNCPARTGYGSGFYVKGVLMACTTG